MPASSRAINSMSDCLTGCTRRLSAPPSWPAACRACVSVCASIKSRTASACVRSIRPARNARCVNSPGSASRAPEASARRSNRSSTTGEPCAAISTRSSAVYELGAANHVTTASSMRADSSSPSRSSSTSARRVRACSRGWRRRTSFCAIEAASGPLSRTMPIPPRPGGVEIAAIVSVLATGSGIGRESLIGGIHCRHAARASPKATGEPRSVRLLFQCTT